jgi:hypothetical protein
MKNSIYDGINLLLEDLQGWNGNSKIFGDLIQKIKSNIIVDFLINNKLPKALNPNKVTF